MKADMGQVFEDGLGAWKPICRFPWVRPLQRQAMLVAVEEGAVRLFRIKVVTRLYVLAVGKGFFVWRKENGKKDF